MNTKYMFLVVGAGLLLGASLRAQEAKPAAAEPAQAEAVKAVEPAPAPAKAAEPVKTVEPAPAGKASPKAGQDGALPGSEGAVKAEAVKPVEPAKVVEPVKAEVPVVESVKPVAKAPVRIVEPAPAPVAKPLSETAKKLLPLVAGYKQAQESAQAWVDEVGKQSQAMDEKISGIQAQVQANEAAITKLKVESEKKNKAAIKERNKDNKQLWAELAAAKKEQAAFNRELSKTAGQKARAYSDDIMTRLKEVQTDLR
ncbi:MAG: hypothetical protein WC881_10705 [Elusimicrobiota bacterium]|jgi:hypothetical protein